MTTAFDDKRVVLLHTTTTTTGSPAQRSRQFKDALEAARVQAWLNGVGVACETVSPGAALRLQDVWVSQKRQQAPKDDGRGARP